MFELIKDEEIFQVLDIVHPADIVDAFRENCRGIAKAQLDDCNRQLLELKKKIEQRFLCLNDYKEDWQALWGESMKPTEDKDAQKKLLRFFSDNIGLYDCQDDCPDEVAIYEQEHGGETLRTPEYCDKCATNKLLAIIERLGDHRDPPEGDL